MLGNDTLWGAHTFLAFTTEGPLLLPPLPSFPPFLATEPSYLLCPSNKKVVSCGGNQKSKYENSMAGFFFPAIRILKRSGFFIDENHACKGINGK